MKIMKKKKKKLLHYKRSNLGSLNNSSGNSFISFACNPLLNINNYI